MCSIRLLANLAAFVQAAHRLLIWQNFRYAQSPHRMENQTAHSTQPELIGLLPEAEKQTSNLTAAIVLFLALLGIAWSSVFFVVAGREMSPTAIAFNRLGIAAIGFALWNALQWAQNSPKTESLELPTRPLDWILLLIAGTSFVSSMMLLAWAFTQTSVAKASLFTHMLPIFTTLGAWIVLKKRFSRRFLGGMTIALLGTIAIGINDFTGTDNSLVGDLAALGAAVCFAVEILIIEQLRSRFPTTILTMSECAIGSVLALPTVILSGNAIFPPSWKSGAAILGLAVLTQMVGHGLLVYSLKRFSASLIAVATLAVPIMSAILALLIFSETIGLFEGTAFAIVLVSIYLSVSAPRLQAVETASQAE